MKKKLKPKQRKYNPDKDLLVGVPLGHSVLDMPHKEWDESFSDAMARHNARRERMNREEWSHTELPNGSYLFWKANEAGGRTYFTDENSIETVVWNTALVDRSTLLAALVQEERLRYEEAHRSGF